MAGVPYRRAEELTVSREKINVAIVGLGFGKEFIPIYQNHPNTNMYAICQRTKEKLDAVGGQYKVSKRYENFEELIRDPNVDAVHINSPIHLHAPQSVAALEAGAPEDIIGCITSPTLEATNALMRHERTGVILSTGGHGIVKAAYSSGKPAFGVGPGNVPVMIERMRSNSACSFDSSPAASGLSFTLRRTSCRACTACVRMC